MIFFEK